jgi:hypothetical protein
MQATLSVIFVLLAAAAQAAPPSATMLWEKTIATPAENFKTQIAINGTFVIAGYSSIRRVS